jgi:hypothetical protein
MMGVEARVAQGRPVAETVAHSLQTQDAVAGRCRTLFLLKAFRNRNEALPGVADGKR